MLFFFSQSDMFERNWQPGAFGQFMIMCTFAAGIFVQWNFTGKGTEIDRKTGKVIVIQQVTQVYVTVPQTQQMVPVQPVS